MKGAIQLEFEDMSYQPGSAQGGTPAAKTERREANTEMRKKTAGRRSLKEPVNKEVVLPPDSVLFARTYYSIGAVAQMLGEQVSLVRHWTNEFKVLKPRKNKKGDRYYKPEDVKTLYLIYNLLRSRKFTIPGAKEFLKNEKSAVEKYELLESLKELKLFLQQLKDNL